MGKLTKADRELVEAAESIIRDRYRRGWHELGAALRTAGGRVVTAVNIDGFNSVCAEAAAIARAVAEGDEEIEAIVAVRYDAERDEARVVPPCGRCRDLISDFGDVIVLYPEGDGVGRATIAELLPSRFEPRRSRRRGG
jgi:cytidine deaminase